MIRPVAVLLAPLVVVGTLVVPLGSQAGAALPASDATFASPAESLGDVGGTLPTGRKAAGARTPAADQQDLDVSLEALTPSVLPRSSGSTTSAGAR